MTMRRLPPLGAALIALLAPGLARAGDIVLKDTVARASIGQSPNTAAYLTIVNSGDKPDRLVSVRCACARQVTIHRTEMTHGMAMMNDAASVVAPPHGQVVFHPEGLHLMVVGLTQPLVAGAEQTFTLVFEHAGPMTARFKVQSRIDVDPAPSAPAMPDTPMGAMPGMAR